MDGPYGYKMASDEPADHQSSEIDQSCAANGFAEPALPARTHKTASPVSPSHHGKSLASSIKRVNQKQVV